MTDDQQLRVWLNNNIIIISSQAMFNKIYMHCSSYFASSLPSKQDRYERPAG